jgi:tetratricopeptide (TPR) repeat protein
MAMPLEVDLRFGRWDEILAAPEPAADLPIARALRRYARGVAHAAKGEVEPARAEQRAFLETRAAVPAEAFFGNNTAADLLAVAEALLEGEILVRDGKTEAGLEALRRAVDLEDRLRYDEPPDWIHPVRHALGAALLQAGKAQEAERVYREDLAKLPENGWSLFGLARSLRLQGKDDEAASMEARFTRAWEKADVKVTSSCFCQPGA